MKILLIWCVIFVAVYCAPTLDGEFNRQWTGFKRLYNKQYKSNEVSDAPGSNGKRMVRAANTAGCSTNAWIFLNEDEPSGTNYESTNSAYQNLIRNKVYQSVDILFMCFASIGKTHAHTVPPGHSDSHTIIMTPVPHSGGLTNLDYMVHMISDARKINPKIKLAITMGHDANLISGIFSLSQYSPQKNAENFAANLVQFLEKYDLDGLDIDWENPISRTTTQEQFALLFNAIGAQFKKQTKKHYYLTLSPAEVGNLDHNAVNNNFDSVNLQLYSGFTNPNDFKNAGINPKLFAYGAKFEGGQQNAASAYQDNKDHYKYDKFTVWRLNSNDDSYEQTQQQILHKLCNPSN